MQAALLALRRMTTSGISPEPNGENLVGAFLVLLFRDTFVAADDAREGGRAVKNTPLPEPGFILLRVCVCVRVKWGGVYF